MSVLNPAVVTSADLPATATRAHPLVVAYLSVSALVFLLMMALGLVMRLAQAGLMPLPPDLFYQVMTAHGVGLVGIAGLATAAIMWHFLSAHVKLIPAVLAANLVLFLLGVVLILGAIFIGGFAAGWTFLYPLPVQSGGAWSRTTAGVYLLGLLLVGTGFLLFYLDAGRAVIVKYRGLGRALGWPLLFAGRGEAPPAAVVASTMVIIINVLGIVSGAAVIAISLINAFVPRFAIDPLLAKNMIFFFGHVFINATIYMAVIAVYEILARASGRPWPVNRIFLAAWTASTLLVLAAYPHHLLMDFVMPTWVLVLAQVLSYVSGLPVLVVTAFGALAIVHRSGMRWDAASALMFLSMFGWAAGVVPAVVDATIAANYALHNTMWVPGHFHFYLLLGMAAMVFGFMYYLGEETGVATPLLDRLGILLYTLGGLGFVAMFLYAGKEGVPRRFAVHLPEWMPYDRIASIFGLCVVLAVVVFVVRFLGQVPRLIGGR
jgi:cytochrome c oxidase subunit 1